MNLASSLSIYSNTSLNSALKTPISDASSFFSTKSFTDSQKSKESEIKIHVAVVNRLNEVIKAIGMLAKIFSR